MSTLEFLNLDSSSKWRGDLGRDDHFLVWWNLLLKRLAFDVGVSILIWQIWQSTSGWSLRTAMLLSTKGVTPFHFQALPMSLPTHRTWEFALSVIYLSAIMKYIVHLKKHPSWWYPQSRQRIHQAQVEISHLFCPLEVTYKDSRAFKRILIHGFMRLPASSTHVPRCFERSRRLPVAYPKLST